MTGASIPPVLRKRSRRKAKHNHSGRGIKACLQQRLPPDDIASMDPNPPSMPVCPMAMHPDVAAATGDVVRAMGVIRLVADRNCDSADNRSGRRRRRRCVTIVGSTGIETKQGPEGNDEQLLHMRSFDVRRGTTFKRESHLPHRGDGLRAEIGPDPVGPVWFA